MKRTALLSAFDKTGLEAFARGLVARDWDLLASAGTTRYLDKRGVVAKDVAEIVGEPILGHRVVTLSRELRAALLSTDSPEDVAELERLGVPRIDLVYVNLYPLRQEVANPDHTLGSVIEKTDIGGPTMLRSAAKGRRFAVSRSSQFSPVIGYLDGDVKWAVGADRFISALASIAEEDIGYYCQASSAYHYKVAGVDLVERLR